MIYHLKITVAQDYIGDDYREASPSTGHNGVAANLDVPPAREQMSSDEDYGNTEIDETADQLASQKQDQKKIDDFVEEVTEKIAPVRHSFVQ